MRAVVDNSYGRSQVPTYYIPKLRRFVRCGGQPRWYGAPTDASRSDRAAVVEWLKGLAVGPGRHAREGATQMLRDIANVQSDASLWEDCDEIERLASEAEKDRIVPQAQ